MGPRGWGTQTGGGPKFRVFSLSRQHFRFFFLSEGLLVELWPRVGAMDFSNCAFGLVWGHFV